MLGTGMGYIPSVQAMKLSVGEDSDFFDDLLGSTDCTMLFLGISFGSWAGDAATRVWGFEGAVGGAGLGLLAFSLPYLLYHATYKSSFVVKGSKSVIIKKMSLA
jgi:hypothetical protein